MDRSPEEIAERLVTTWLMRANPIGGTAEEVAECISTVYAKILQAVKGQVSHVPWSSAEEIAPFLPDKRE